MMGFNIMSASHFDEYLVDFTMFKPGPIAPTVFDKPQLCEKHHKPTAAAAATAAPQESEQEQELLTAQAMSSGAAVMPWAKAVTQVTRPSSSSSNDDGANLVQQQQLRRLAALAQNAEFVQGWNQRDLNSNSNAAAGFKLSLNHLAVMLPEEYQMLRGRRSSSRSKQVKQVSCAVQGRILLPCKHVFCCCFLSLL
jgi:hypothetical protein